MTSFRSLPVSSRRGVAKPTLALLVVVASVAFLISACDTNTTAQADRATTPAPNTDSARSPGDDSAVGTATEISPAVRSSDSPNVSEDDAANSAPGGDNSAPGGDNSAPGGASSDTSMAQVELTIVVSDGTTSGDTGRQEIGVGETVAIVVSADATDDVHVHGYDLAAPVAPDQDATIVFTADVPGIFEVELEGAGLPLTELLVR